MNSSSAEIRDRNEMQAVLLERLMNPAAYPHPVTAIRRLETHISRIFLTGQFAYKIKKPVDLGFLDFTRVEQRYFYCQEELRLNRRLAPQLYLEVVPIADVASGVCIGTAAQAVEYAVKMLEFPQSSLFDSLLPGGALSAKQIDALADRVAAFHLQVARADSGDEHGGASAVWTAVGEAQIRLRELFGELDEAADEIILLDAIEAWARHEYARLKDLLAERKRAGFVRECHGDLHLGNIAWWLDAPQIFDCIEFSGNLRWIDVISEIAFTTMDLAVHGCPDYAWRFLNRYLESSGDYGGLELLTFYEVYRAVVRAMVACIRTVQQGTGSTASTKHASCCRYLAFAGRDTIPRRRQVLLMHGYSGSGKTTVAQAVLESIGAIRVRSDVERKRLFGLAGTDRSNGTLESGIYDAETTRLTYQHLARLAQQVLDAGFPVLIDAASLKVWQRDIFRGLAQAEGVPFRLISCRAEEEVMYRRLYARQAADSDISDAGPDTLTLQLENSEPLTPAEEQECLLFDSDKGSLDYLVRQLVAETGL